MSIEEIAKMLEQAARINDYVNAIHDYCKNLHNDFGEDTACKKCVLGKYDEYGVHIICKILDGKPLDWM